MRDLLENIFLGICIIVFFFVVVVATLIIGGIAIMYWKVTIPLIILGIILGVVKTIIDR